MMTEKTKDIIVYSIVAIMAIAGCVLLYLTLKPFYYGFMVQAVDYFGFWGWAWVAVCILAIVVILELDGIRRAIKK